MHLLSALGTLYTTSALPFGQSLEDQSVSLLDVPQSDQPTQDCRPFINSEALQNMMSEQAFRELAQKVWESAKQSIRNSGSPSRHVGTDGHCRTLKMLSEAMGPVAHHYKFSAQNFTSDVWEAKSWSIDTYTERNLTSQVMYRSPGRSPVDAPVRFAKNFGCDLADYEGAYNHVVVVKRGGCWFHHKAQAAGRAKAAAILIYDPNTEPNKMFAGRLTQISDDFAPTFIISKEAADKLTEGSRVIVQSIISRMPIPTYNVIAETNSGDHNNVIVVGAHIDTVQDSPGVNDNGSGLALLIELMRHLAKFRLQNAVRFVWFSAEEQRIQGSSYYVDSLSAEEKRKIRMFLNFDMIASPNYVLNVYNGDDTKHPVGSQTLRDTFIDWYRSHGYNYGFEEFNQRSDYEPFLGAGIPTGGVSTGINDPKTPEEAQKFGGQAGAPIDPCYHKACDGLNNVSYEAWMASAKAAAHVIAKYAADLSGFPQRV